MLRWFARGAAALAVSASWAFAALAQGGDWDVRTERSRIDDRMNVYVSRAADEEIVSWPRRRHRPVLFFRCMERRLQAFVETGAIEAGDTSAIRVRFDQQPVQRQRWANSNDGEAVFAPNGLDLLRRALAARRMVFEITPFNSRTMDVAFDLTGLRDRLQSLMTACGIQPRALGLTAAPAAPSR